MDKQLTRHHYMGVCSYKHNKYFQLWIRLLLLHRACFILMLLLTTAKKISAQQTILPAIFAVTLEVLCMLLLCITCHVSKSSHIACHVSRMSCQSADIQHISLTTTCMRCTPYSTHIACALFIICIIPCTVYHCLPCDCTCMHVHLATLPPKCVSIS